MGETWGVDFGDGLGVLRGLAGGRAVEVWGVV